MLSTLFLLGGLALLAAGGEVLVRSAGSLATRAGVSALVAGTLIVGPGTSMPELVVSVLGAVQGQADIAVGNVVGSNISNGLLILGSAVLILPMVIHRDALMRDGLGLIGVTVALVILMQNSVIGRGEGLLLLAGLIGWLAWTLLGERRRESARKQMLQDEVEVAVGAAWRTGPSIAALAGSLLALGAGATLTVTAARDLAIAAGIDEVFIGLTVVAVGTSLPEWIVTLIAALRRKPDVAIGNILGSNLFNILGILGVSALVTPLSVSPLIMGFDRWVMLGGTLLLVGFLATGQRLTRWEGGVLLAVWMGWFGWLVYGQMG